MLPVRCCASPLGWGRLVRALADSACDGAVVATTPTLALPCCEHQHSDLETRLDVDRAYDLALNGYSWRMGGAFSVPQLALSRAPPRARSLLWCCLFCVEVR
jgi:hypothetical protein